LSASKPPKPASLTSDLGATDSFASLRALGERQLQIQFTLASMYDTQAMGVLALDAGLAAAAIAADRFLGQDWWLTLIGFFLSSAYCCLALGTRGDEAGPEIKPLILGAGKTPAREMDKAIVISIANAIADNAPQLERKNRRIWKAIAIVGITIVCAVICVLVF
jgi:hypothetical protein